MGGKKNTGSVLSTELQKKAYAQLDPWQIAALKGGSLFQVFLGDLVPYKGALVSGFSQRGGRLKTKIEADFGDVLCPGLATAAVNAKVSAEHSAYMMMILSRMPSSSGTLDFAEPWTLACLTGYLAGWRVSVGGEVGIKKGASGIEGDKDSDSGPSGFQSQEKPTSSASLWEDAAAKCEAKAVLEGELYYEGHRLKLRDSAPLAYCTNSDPELSREFESLLGPGDKHTVKRRALSIFDDAGLSEEMKKCKPERNVFRRVFRSGHMSSFAEIEVGLAALESKIDDSDWPQSKKDRYLGQIEFHRKDIETYRSFDLQEILQERDKNRQAALLSRGGESENTNRGFQHVTSRFCFIDLWGHKPGASATAKAEATVQLAGSGVTASAQIGVEGGVKWTLYRYQTYVSQYSRKRVGDPAGSFRNVVAEASRKQGLKAFKNLELSRDMLVMTQDTRITYKSVALKGKVGVEVRTPIKNKDLGPPEKEIAGYSAMSYRSAVVYWRVPYSRDVAASISMPAEKGSGYSIGHSYPTKRLFEQAGGAGIDEYAQTVASDLSCDLDCTKQFLTEIAPLLPALFGQADAVLLEASFAVPAGYRFPVKEAQKNNYQWHEPATGLRDGFKPHMAKELGISATLIRASPRRRPSVLRLRARQGDFVDNTETKFKLGFKFVLGVEIELESIEKAGRESIIDLHNTFFNDSGSHSVAATRSGMQSIMKTSARDLLGKKPSGLSALQKFRLAGRGLMQGAAKFKQNFEDVVPPVALLHQ